MQNRNYILAGLCFLTIAISSCRKNDTLPTNETVDDATTVTATIKGVVVNENEVPVIGATVTLGNNTVTTNATGAFEFRNKTMSANNAHIKVAKSGYFNGNRTMMISAGRTHLTRIKLIPKPITGTVNAASGGAVNLASGGKVTFPANAFIDASGAAYTGTVNVSMAWINPTANDLAQTMPGDLRGINTIGGERALETYGMLGVEITNTSGQQIKLGAGKTAELRFPIPAALLASAPLSIPLWDFDEASGRWKEEGTANKVGSEYVGNVSHFSFWNCDVPANFVNLCVTVLSPNNQPLNNVPVRIRKANSPAVTATGYTDSAGVNCGAVFKNEPLILEVLDRCGNVVYTQNIGPYSSNASVTVTATIPAANMLTLTGTLLNCSNAPVTTGSVLITTTGGHSYNAAVNASGVFTVSLLNCNNSIINYTVQGVDNATLQFSAPTAGSGSSGSTALGNIVACGTTASEYIQATVDGVPFAWIKPIDSVGGFNGGGATLPTFAASCNMFGNNGATGGTNGSNNITTLFSYNNVAGIYPIQTCFLGYRVGNVSNTSQQINSASPQVNLTTVGASGTGFLIGNYSITMPFSPGNITRNVYVNFKVRRP